MSEDDPSRWTVTARNLPEHATNRIHTDEGAREQGFPSALVAGVTTYGYLTHPVVSLWGEAWLAAGAAEVRFLAPVFADDALTLTMLAADPVEPLAASGTVTVEATVDTRPGPLATVTAWRAPEAGVLERLAAATAAAAGPDAEDLAPREYTLTGDWASYGSRIGDDHELYGTGRVVHPCIWPSLANQLTHAQVVRGSWVHTNSLVVHHSIVHAGDTVVVRAHVLRRWRTRRGERAELLVRLATASDPVATVVHEALVALDG